MSMKALFCIAIYTYTIQYISVYYISKHICLKLERHLFVLKIHTTALYYIL